MFAKLFYPILCAYLISSAIHAEPQVTPLAIGAQAPDFSLPGTDGKTYSLDSFKDARYLVVVFTCNHCPDARAARDRINHFAKEYAKKGVQVVAISGNDPKAVMKLELGYSVYDDSFEDMKIVAKAHGYTHPYLYDGDTQKATLAYGALATPHCFILGPDRKLLYHGQFDNGYRNPGPATKNTVKDTIDALLAGKAVPAATTRAFGCSTKWSWKRDWAKKNQAEWKQLPTTVAPLTVEQATQLIANKTDKVRIINLWSTTCGPCIAEFPDLIDTYQRFQTRPVELITIAIDPKKDADKVLKLLQSQHLPTAPNHTASIKAEGRTTNNYHYQSDDLEALADAIDLQWQGPIPHTLIIAPGGKITYRHSGQIDPAILRKEILKTLQPEVEAFFK